MKKLLLASFVCSALLGNAAETLEFSYVDSYDGVVFGTKKLENFDVAIFLPGDQFKDFKIASVKAPLNTFERDTLKKYDYYSNVSVWVSTELRLDTAKNNKNKNLPDVSYAAAIDENGYVNLELPETYTISDKGAYVGFSFNVESLNGATKYPVGVGKPCNENGLWVHSSRTYLSWINMASIEGYSAAISVGLQSDKFPSNAVRFSKVPESVYAGLDTDRTVNVQLSTLGSQPVYSVDYDITVAGNTSSYHYDLPDTVPARLGKIFDASVVIPAQSNLMSKEDMTLTVTKVNGAENEAVNGISASSRLDVYKFIPEHQALFEEYTGVGCGYCPMGFVTLEYLKENYPKFVVASYHTKINGKSDAMECMNKFPLPASETSLSAPSYCLERKTVCYFDAYNVACVDDILAINEQLTPWDIKIAHTWDDDNTLTASVDVTSIENIEGKFKIAYILVSDGLTGSGSKWIQENYYNSNGQSNKYIPGLNDFCHGGIYGKSKVSGLVFDDVVITDQGVHGIAGSLPETINAYEVHSHSFTFDLTKIAKELIPDKNKLRIIAAVLDANGTSLNCAKNEVNDYAGAAVDQIGVTDGDAPVEYYNLNGVKVDNPANGIFIRRQGSRTSKVVK